MQNGAQLKAVLMKDFSMRLLPRNHSDQNQTKSIRFDEELRMGKQRILMIEGSYQNTPRVLSLLRGCVMLDVKGRTIRPVRDRSLVLKKKSTYHAKHDVVPKRPTKTKVVRLCAMPGKNMKCMHAFRQSTREGLQLTEKQPSHTVRHDGPMST